MGLNIPKECNVSFDWPLAPIITKRFKIELADNLTVMSNKKSLLNFVYYITFRKIHSLAIPQELNERKKII